MKMLSGKLRRFADSSRGVAALEFAIIMPVILLLFLGTFDAGNAIAVYAKVRAATYALGAITNQYGNGQFATTPISTTIMTTITGATTAILAPYSSSPVTVVISQIKATSSTQATVNWSYSPTAGQALTQNNPFTLPTNFITNSCGASVSSSNPCYAIYAQVSYTFTPSFGAFITGPITLSDSLYTTPRITTCVQYNSTPSSC
jgi:Flp pilus assembly protein TadG